MRIEAYRHGIDTGKAFEQDGFALHDRQSGTGADVAETEYGRAVCDDGDSIALHGVVVDGARIVLDCEAWSGYARGIGERQIFGFIQRHFAAYLQLAFMFPMQGQ